MGVDVKPFLEASETKYVLNKSYRVPEHSFAIAQGLTDQITITRKQMWNPTEEKGFVSWYNDILDVDMTRASG